MTWSLCMIVKNEENNIENCLNSVKNLFDEIIIVDTGSTDRTKEVVGNHTNKVYDFKWIDNFSAARNFAFSKASKDYIMWLDADDIVKKDDYQKLLRLKKNMNNDVDIYMMKYHIAFDENNKPTFSYYRERLIKREKNYQWQDRVHEYIPLIGKIKKCEIGITHNKKEFKQNKRNLKIYQKMEKGKEKFTPRNLYYYGRELYDHGLYKKAMKKFNDFLLTEEGWIEDNITACYMLTNCYYYLDNQKEALNSLFKTFLYDIPRRKTCCLIGNYFLNLDNYLVAKYWYHQALKTLINTQGFYESDYDYFIPYINLCVCYDRLGDKKSALKYHLLSQKIKPNNTYVIQNQEYFKNHKQ